MTQRRIYQNEYPYFITFRTREGLLLFGNEKMAGLLAEIIFNAGRLKRFGILAYQIMPDHVHMLTWKKSDRTLERGRSGWGNIQPHQTVGMMRSGWRESPHHHTERTFSNVRSACQQTISDLIQSIKGNFSRDLHIGSIWQPRFYSRIVDTNQYLRTVFAYIQHNPTKTELPARFHQPPYQYFNWQKIKNLF